MSNLTSLINQDISSIMLIYNNNLITTEEFVSIFDDISWDCEYRDKNMCTGYNEEGKCLIVVCNPTNCIKEVEIEKHIDEIIGHA